MSSEANESGRCDASPAGRGHEKIGFDDEEEDDVDICHEHQQSAAERVVCLPAANRANALCVPIDPNGCCDGCCCRNPWPNRTG